MLRMCVYMHFCFVENHPIRILEDGPFISEGVLSHLRRYQDPLCIMSPCSGCILDMGVASQGILVFARGSSDV
jgi:hypothetical protein